MRFFDTLLPVPEQVLEVPKILPDEVPMRTSVRHPQLVEQLVEVPTIISFVISTLSDDLLVGSSSDVAAAMMSFALPCGWEAWPARFVAWPCHLLGCFQLLLPDALLEACWYAAMHDSEHEFCCEFPKILEFSGGLSSKEKDKGNCRSGSSFDVLVPQVAAAGAAAAWKAGASVYIFGLEGVFGFTCSFGLNVSIVAAAASGNVFNQFASLAAWQAGASVYIFCLEGVFGVTCAFGQNASILAAAAAGNVFGQFASLAAAAWCACALVYIFCVECVFALGCVFLVWFLACGWFLDFGGHVLELRIENLCCVAWTQHSRFGPLTGAEKQDGGRTGAGVCSLLAAADASEDVFPSVDVVVHDSEIHREDRPNTAGCLSAGIGDWASGRVDVPGSVDHEIHAMRHHSEASEAAESSSTPDMIQAMVISLSGNTLMIDADPEAPVLLLVEDVAKVLGLPESCFYLTVGSRVLREACLFLRKVSVRTRWFEFVLGCGVVCMAVLEAEALLVAVTLGNGRALTRSAGPIGAGLPSRSASGVELRKGMGSLRIQGGLPVLLRVGNRANSTIQGGLHRCHLVLRPQCLRRQSKLLVGRRLPQLLLVSLLLSL